MLMMKSLKMYFKLFPKNGPRVTVVFRLFGGEEL